MVTLKKTHIYYIKIAKIINLTKKIAFQFVIMSNHTYHINNYQLSPINRRWLDLT